MYLPSSIMIEMQIPSLYLKIKETGRIYKAYEPHPNGTHLRFERSLKWYSLDELDLATEEDYQNQINLIKQARTEEAYKKVLYEISKGCS